MKTSLFKLILFFTCCHFAFQGQSQNDSHIKFRSIYAELGMFTTLDDLYYDSTDFNGLNFMAGVDFLWDDVIFGVRTLYGTSPDIMDYFEYGDESYFEWDLTVGREWKISEAFSFEGNIGVGIFYHTIEAYEFDFKETFFALSLKPMLRYYFTDHLSAALGSQFNILPLFLSGGIALQYHFN